MPSAVPEIIPTVDLSPEGLVKGVLDAVNIIITEECDSKCGSCSYWMSTGRHLSVSDLRDDLYPIVRAASPKVVRLTGGEPTLHPDLVEICRLFADVGSVGLVMNTHGYRLDRVFPSIRNLVSAYIISLDSSTATGYHRIRGVPWFHQILRQPPMIHNYSENLFVAFSTVIQRENVGELVEIAELARDVGVDLLTFSIPTFVPGTYHNTTSRAAKQKRRLSLSLTELATLDRQISQLINMREALLPMRVLQSDTVLWSYSEILRARALGQEHLIPIRKCALPHTTVTISSTKSIKPCFILPDAFPIQGESLQNGPPLAQFRRDFIETDHAVTRTCRHCYVYPYLFEDSLDQLAQALVT